MNRFSAKYAAGIVFLLCNTLLSLAVLVVLWNAPYTGMRITGNGGSGQVLSVDRSSPAWAAGIREGDTITGCDGRTIPPAAFFDFPDYPVSRHDIEAYWHGRKLLATRAAKGTLSLQLVREGKSYTAVITFGRFPWWRICTVVVSFMSVAWAFQLLSLLVILRKDTEAARLNFIASSLLCTMMIVDALFAPGELVFPWLSYRWLYNFNYVAALVFPFTAFHMMLVFPERLDPVNRNRLLIPALYLAALVCVLLEFATVSDNTLLTTSYPQIACFVGAFAVLGYRYRRETKALQRKQMQWALFGFAVGLGWGAFLFTPYAQDLRGVLVYDELIILPIMVTPASLAIAIVRYRFMGISRLVDTTVAFLATILLLFAVEFLVIWGVFQGQPSLESTYSNSVTVIKTLLIVLLFIPVRNFVRKVLDRLFRRGNYDSAEELKNFMVRLSVQDGRSAIEKFGAFAENLLDASGCCVVKNLPAPHILHADTDDAHRMGESICAGGEMFWTALGRKNRSCYGPAWSRMIAGDVELHQKVEECVFIPLVVESRLQYCAVLLWKRSGRLYSAKDMELTDGLSLSLGKVLEAEEVRQAHEAAEAEFHRQKEGVIQEMHDVLGNIITSIAVTAQAAGRFRNDPERVEDLLGKIGTFSNQATDFLRTGLTVLDNLDAGVGEVLHAMKRRFADVLETVGISLVMEIAPEVHGMKTAPGVTIHLLRCMQEAVNNIIKHSGAGTVTISLFTEGVNLIATISDDGHGFPDKQPMGYGLRNIAARVEALDGAMSVGPLSPTGTTISISIPAARLNAVDSPLQTANTPCGG